MAKTTRAPESPRARPPAIGRLLTSGRVVPLLTLHGHQRVVVALRQAREQEPQAGPDWDERIAERARSLLGPGRRLVPVINGTGVVVHTNLGRAPIAAAAARRAAELAMGYTNLELDLESGGRGDRQDLLQDLLRDLTGAEAAVVVNNGAAALLLALTALCSGREVVVSRGEAVEIGGGFRIPEVLRLSRAKLVDVGTTNRTRLQDYQAACNPKTAAFLRVHPSNFRIEGFTQTVPRARLAELAHRQGVLLLEDLGSGLLGPVTAATPGEDPLRQSLAQGADLAFASGDKLVGASQAGLAVGRADQVARMRRHPLFRALRPDKLQLAALEETLLCHATPGRLAEVPVWQMLRVPLAELRRRCQAWAERLAALGVAAEVVPLRGAVGGGASPGRELSSWGLRIGHPGRRRVRQALLGADPPVLVLERAGAVVLDARTVLPGQDAELLGSLASVLAPAAGGRPS